MHVEQRSHCVCVSDLPASDLYLPVGHATHTSALLAVHGAEPLLAVHGAALLAVHGAELWREVEVAGATSPGPVSIGKP